MASNLSFFLVLCALFVSGFAQYNSQPNQGGQYNNKPSTPTYADWEFYSQDGSGNNVQNPTWGQAGTLLLYNFEPIPFSVWQEDPLAVNERIASNIVSFAKHNQPRTTPRNNTDFLTAWGQFTDHDIIHIPTGPISVPIEVPKGDKFFDPAGHGNVSFAFSRSSIVGGQFQHPNSITGFIDGSQIYGSSIKRNHALREFSGGRMRASKIIMSDEGEWPILFKEIQADMQQFVVTDNNAMTVPTDTLFACGDQRCSENPLLLSLQVLFFREHNRVVGILARKNPTWNDEELYQKGRSYVIAELQHITFTEYLFFLMGQRPFDFPYQGYRNDVNPGVNIFFSTVAFRYGHSEVNHLVRKMIKGSYGTFPRTYYAQMREFFFDPVIVYEDGLGPMFEGMWKNAQSSMDNEASDDIRNFLFAGVSQRPSADLIAIDLRRARDHGCRKYSDMREVYGLPRVDRWEDFEPLDVDDEIDPVQLVRMLMFLYPTPADCDAFLCGLSEDWVETDVTEDHDDYSNLGMFFEAVLHEQFRRTRDGDRFWYEQDFMQDNLASLGLEDVNERTLNDVMRDNVQKDLVVGASAFFNSGLLGLSRKRTGVNKFTVQIPLIPTGW